MVEFPGKHTVFQRNQANEGQIPVGGICTFPYQKIEARLVSIPQNEGNSGPWTSLNVPARKGVFYGVLTAKGGWYQLQLRGIKEGEEADTTSVFPIGVGEVFLVAGHSNAMGLPDLGAKGGSNQVVSFNALNKILNVENITVAPNAPMPSPTFSPFDAKNFAFPSGESAWYWSELGQLISDRLKVPVLFMNAGWAAANSVNWREAAQGSNTLNIYVGKNWPNRQPYSNLINTLRYYHSWLGIRGVLWFHGENDAGHLKIAQQDYYANIRYVIEKSMADFGHPLTWIIGQCTYNNSNPEPYLPVLNAQAQLITTPGLMAWGGPYTDTIQVPRPSHGHFENIPGGIPGLSQMAQAWNRSLPDAFFAQRPAHTSGSSIMSGVVPREASPGHQFLLPYRVIGSLPATSKMEAHLLDQQGQFIAIVGNGSQNPLRVSLPPTLVEGNYSVRVIAQDPVLVGSVSSSFVVRKGLSAPQPIRSLEMQVLENQTLLHTLLAADPENLHITLERSDDLIELQAVETVQIASSSQSGLFTLTDTQPSDQSTYYRIRLDQRSGGTQYSQWIATFRGNAPLVFSTFPNPVSVGQPIYIRTDPAQLLNFQLFNATGQPIQASLSESDIIGLSAIYPFQPLEPGVYLLQITTPSGGSSQRIMVR
jgi:hypothetical protein